ncbi:UbiD family decarboxylase [Sulfuracidifex tepidarius]|uniref:3-octaprenyl-4-hydroxybenzoate carboxy-lyase n=1 Tax=Sulfuracidifex tepidarius TaxID=1294262 RepID=A0A510DUC2_9CREN|nr:UbiD family decarboxylase [Sulfuracidifex tepidarius]BBG23826.1 3-octaprenyl-4-hydroxybenzoate carboxy-lyase [Sulfuracidifex tepidarius]BBG26581.1 3-octaprenyl-4-hydroxybenzoate carboxy-lyase [Sulfuracidifex tepidarius]
MAFSDLREYLNYMRKNGKLIEVDSEVSTDLEIAEISRKATYSHLYPLIFSRVKEFPKWKVVSNVFYSLEGVYDVLQTRDLESISKSFLEGFSDMPVTLLDKVKSLRDVLKLGKFTPRAKKPSFAKSDLKLTSVPAIKTWPKDAGRFFTFSLTITKDPDTGVHNVSVYRIQIIDDERAIIHWQAFKRGSMTAMRYKEKGITKVPVAIVNGVDPAVAFTAASPVPAGLDKYLFAGIMRGEGVGVTELDNGIMVPSSAETVFEGYVNTDELMDEGPFGDHLGYYTPKDLFPVFHLTKSYSREDPYFHVTSVGKPPLEDAWIGKGVERIFLPFAKMVIPELVDMNLPEYGVFTGVGIFSVKKYYPGQAKRAMMAIWGLGQLSLLKFVIVVDSDVDVHDLNEVLFALSTRVDPQRDVMIVNNVLTDSLDFSTPSPPLGSKIGIDATRKFKEETGREWPEEVTSDPDVQKKAEEIISKLKSRYLPS